MTWYRESEQVMLDRLCEEWNVLSGQTKMELMLTAPDAYFAVDRVVKHHEVARKLAESEKRRRADD